MARAGIRLPVAAIGGITEEDVPQVMACGVNGIALSGAISRAGEIAAATARFTELVAAHRTIVTPRTETAEIRRHRQRGKNENDLQK